MAMIAVIVLSFQTGRRSHLSLNGVSFHWFGELFKEQRSRRFQGFVPTFPLYGTDCHDPYVVITYRRGYRKPFRFAGAIFYVTVAIVPSI